MNLLMKPNSYGLIKKLFIMSVKEKTQMFSQKVNSCGII